MRYLVRFVLLLLALGTLRTVGCGDEGPECIYPSDSWVGWVRDATCDDDDQCTEGYCDDDNTCVNLSWFRDGERCDLDVTEACHIGICTDGRCERTEKPCDPDFHEDCADLLTYDCDPDTGAVECTWRMADQGQQCCFELDICFWPGPHYCCERYGWCIDGGCVIGNGYPRDCTERDDATPCEVGDVIGLCWKGDCAVLDCDDSVQGEVCWSSGGATSRCSGHQCYWAWNCPRENHGAADGCHCGCGVIDPDCADRTVGSCDTCDAPGSCSRRFGYSGCPGAIDPAQNWRCDGSGGTGGTGGTGGNGGG
jgi:hypothetical protein